MLKTFAQDVLIGFGGAPVTEHLLPVWLTFRDVEAVAQQRHHKLTQQLQNLKFL
jgi:hypothetical protein